MRAKNRMILSVRNTVFLVLVILAIMAVPLLIGETIESEQTHSKVHGPAKLVPYNDAPEFLERGVR